MDDKGPAIESTGATSDVELQRLALEQKKFEHQAELDRRTLELEEKRAQSEQRFLTRHLAAVLVFAGTLFTVILSLVQLVISDRNNRNSLTVQKEKYDFDSLLDQRNPDSAIKKQSIDLITTNQNKLISTDASVRERFRAIFAATFPEIATQWLQSLALLAPPGGTSNSNSEVEKTADNRAPQTADWMKHIDWAIRDSGPVDCPNLYVSTYPDCIFGGGRSCLMRRAITAARLGDFPNALKLVTITQCHSPSAMAALNAAGPINVRGYLKSQP
jgi:hypothetical protein